ncbi:VWA domain-containing protein [Weeksellaceae bacterium TAE3-ERU29]|nr:VWA domain-containing protein [Weeksellaceae bacterium TAE3-ERU29]
MISWEKPTYGFLFLAIIVVIYLFWYLYKWQKTAISKFADAHLISKILGNKTPFRFITPKRVFLVLSLTFMVLALIGPQWGEESQIIKREGIDIVFAVDVSNSMNAEDVAPSRLEKAQNFIETFINESRGDRIGLVIFAGKAFSISPLTEDYISINSYVDAFDSDLIWDQGTNFTAAINNSVQVLGNNPQTSKVIVLISDGENHEGGINKAIEKAKNNNIEIFTMGIGSETPTPIPMYGQFGEVEYKKDKNGKTVLTTFNSRDLKSIAQKSNGKYIKIESTKQATQELKFAIDSLKKQSISESLSINKKKQFQWFLGLSILFLFMYNLTFTNRINH